MNKPIKAKRRRNKQRGQTATGEGEEEGGVIQTQTWSQQSSELNRNLVTAHRAQLPVFQYVARIRPPRALLTLMLVLSFVCLCYFSSSPSRGAPLSQHGKGHRPEVTVVPNQQSMHTRGWSPVGSDSTLSETERENTIAASSAVHSVRPRAHPSEQPLVAPPLPSSSLSPSLNSTSSDEEDEDSSSSLLFIQQLGMRPPHLHAFPSSVKRLHHALEIDRAFDRLAKSAPRQSYRASNVTHVGAKKNVHTLTKTGPCRCKKVPSRKRGSFDYDRYPPPPAPPAASSASGGRSTPSLVRGPVLPSLRAMRKYYKDVLLIVMTSPAREHLVFDIRRHYSRFFRYIVFVRGGGAEKVSEDELISSFDLLLQDEDHTMHPRLPGINSSSGGSRRSHATRQVLDHTSPFDVLYAANLTLHRVPSASAAHNNNNSINNTTSKGTYTYALALGDPLRLRQSQRAALDFLWRSEADETSDQAEDLHNTSNINRTTFPKRGMKASLLSPFCSNNGSPSYTASHTVALMSPPYIERIIGVNTPRDFMMKGTVGQGWYGIGFMPFLATAEIMGRIELLEAMAVNSASQLDARTNSSVYNNNISTNNHNHHSHSNQRTAQYNHRHQQYVDSQHLLNGDVPPLCAPLPPSPPKNSSTPPVQRLVPCRSIMNSRWLRAFAPWLFPPPSVDFLPSDPCEQRGERERVEEKEKDEEDQHVDGRRHADHTNDAHNCSDCDSVPLDDDENHGDDDDNDDDNWYSHEGHRKGEWEWLTDDQFLAETGGTERGANMSHIRFISSPLRHQGQGGAKLPHIRGTLFLGDDFVFMPWEPLRSAYDKDVPWMPDTGVMSRPYSMKEPQASFEDIRRKEAAVADAIRVITQFSSAKSRAPLAPTVTLADGTPILDIDALLSSAAVEEEDSKANDVPSALGSTSTASRLTAFNMAKKLLDENRDLVITDAPMLQGIKKKPSPHSSAAGSSSAEAEVDTERARSGRQYRLRHPFDDPDPFWSEDREQLCSSLHNSEPFITPERRSLERGTGRTLSEIAPNASLAAPSDLCRMRGGEAAELIAYWASRHDVHVVPPVVKGRRVGKGKRLVRQKQKKPKTKLVATMTRGMGESSSSLGPLYPLQWDTVEEEEFLYRYRKGESAEGGSTSLKTRVSINPRVPFPSPWNEDSSMAKAVGIVLDRYVPRAYNPLLVSLRERGGGSTASASAALDNESLGVSVGGDEMVVGGSHMYSDKENKEVAKERERADTVDVERKKEGDTNSGENSVVREQQAQSAGGEEGLAALSSSECINRAEALAIRGLRRVMQRRKQIANERQRQREAERSGGNGSPPRTSKQDGGNYWSLRSPSVAEDLLPLYYELMRRGRPQQYPSSSSSHGDSPSPFLGLWQFADERHRSNINNKELIHKAYQLRDPLPHSRDSDGTLPNQRYPLLPPFSRRVVMSALRRIPLRTLAEHSDLTLQEVFITDANNRSEEDSSVSPPSPTIAVKEKDHSPLVSPALSHRVRHIHEIRRTRVASASASCSPTTDGGVCSDSVVMGDSRRRDRQDRMSNGVKTKRRTVYASEANELSMPQELPAELFVGTKSGPRAGLVSDAVASSAIFYSIMDAYYVPRHLFPSFVWLSFVGGHCNCFQEMYIPTMLRILQTAYSRYAVSRNLPREEERGQRGEEAGERRARFERLDAQYYWEGLAMHCTRHSYFVCPEAVLEEEFGDEPGSHGSDKKGGVGESGFTPTKGPAKDSSGPTELRMNSMFHSDGPYVRKGVAGIHRCRHDHAFVRRLFGTSRENEWAGPQSVEAAASAKMAMVLPKTKARLITWPQVGLPMYEGDANIGTPLPYTSSSCFAHREYDGAPHHAWQRACLNRTALQSLLWKKPSHLRERGAIIHPHADAGVEGGLTDPQSKEENSKSSDTALVDDPAEWIDSSPWQPRTGTSQDIDHKEFLKEAS